MSNFHTFTGSSRRPRNVNLSGQPSVINPFAPGSGAWIGTPSRTVTKAQADRQQRQRERERTQAARTIQGAFRCHTARQTANDLRRELFDRQYRHGQPASRVQECLPLLLRFYTAKKQDDVERLRGLCDDIASAGTARPSSVSTTQVQQLLRNLLDLLPLPSTTPDKNADFLRLVVSITKESPDALIGVAEYYYKSLVRLTQEGPASEVWANALGDAGLAPLTALGEAREGPGGSSSPFDQDQTRTIYRAFAFNYLVGSNLGSLEERCTAFAEGMDINALCSVIAASYSAELGNFGGYKSDGLLWLLAHFIHLCSCTPAYQPAAVLECLYVQISTLADDIRRRYGATAAEFEDESSSAKNRWSGPLHSYVRGQLSELVSKASVQNLLSQLSVRGQTRTTMNLLAGYLLTLLRCFPSSSDANRMLIYQCDLPTADGLQPIVNNFWELTKTTSIFRDAVRDGDAPVTVLRNYLWPHDNDVDSRETEWRVVLLFLELYNFTLRVAGDDDFMAGVKPDPTAAAGKPSRLQTCCLSLGAVSDLCVFLKRLSFALYHDASKITPPQQRRLTGDATINVDLNSSSSLAQARTEATTRLDLDGLKSIIPATMQLIYEKDSRLRFLPAGKWLMTSRFKMDDFMADVVAEWKRRQEAEAEGSEDGEADVDSDGEEESFRFTARYQTEFRLRQRHELAKRQREQRLARVGPKIEILQHMPFTIPFETRANIFKQFIVMDQSLRRNGHVEADLWRSTVNSTQAQRHHGRIQRGRCFEDAYNDFYSLQDGLKEPVFITFLDRFGEEEAGIDGGGVTKEFLISAITEAFQDGEPWFTRNAQGVYCPNPGIVAWHREMRARKPTDEAQLAESQAEALRKLEFLGRLVGKCLYEGILIDVSFAGFFLMRWRTGADKEGAGYKCTVNDLRDVDEDLYKGLIRLKNEQGDVSDWDLNFTIDDDIWFGDGRERFTATRTLVPGGEDQKVTNENRLLFLARTAQHRLVTQPAAETRAFVQGLQTMIDPSWLSMFNQTELQRLVGGDSRAIDLDDLKRNTSYSGLYVVGDDHLLHPTIDLFWKVMEGFSDAQRRDVVKFVTSTPRAPLLGFSQLYPRFGIRDSAGSAGAGGRPRGGGGGASGGAGGGAALFFAPPQSPGSEAQPAPVGREEDMRLPSASTCINLLKLPLYKTEAVMKQKLLQAISSGAGFDLS